MKTIIYRLIAICSFLMLCFVNADSSIYAATDQTPPHVSSVNIHHILSDNNDCFNVEMDVVETETGIEKAQLLLYTYSSSGKPIHLWVEKEFSKDPQFSGVLSFEWKGDSTTIEEGRYYITSIFVYDVAGNKAVYSAPYSFAENEDHMSVDYYTSGSDRYLLNETDETDMCLISL